MAAAAPKAINVPDIKLSITALKNVRLVFLTDPLILASSIVAGLFIVFTSSFPCILVPY